MIIPLSNQGDAMKKSSDHILLGPSKIPSANFPKKVGGAWGILSGSADYHASSDATLFSSSLPVLPHEKLNLIDTEIGCQSIDDASTCFNKLDQDVDDNDSLGDIGTHAIGSLLPDDEDELLAGIMDDFDLSGLPSRLDDLDEYDLFGSGGGMELENNLQENLSLGLSKMSLSDGVIGNGMASFGIPNGVGSVAGEHPYGEHPSRTLFVRNINSNVEDSELRTLFEQYGDIRTLYTACKHRGFVMISYYDIRAARTAMRALQNKPLRRRKLDIHFSIPKDNPSDKDVNQGTLVVFNLDPSVSNEDLRQRFGEYGEVKEIRETPHKRHHKFIEFYDVRAAEAALRALNRSDIAGKRIKLEPSRPGGARRNLMLQINQELEHDESQTFRHQLGSSIGNSPPGNWMQFSSPIEHSPLHTFSKSPGLGTVSPNTSNHLPGLASILHPQVSNSVKVAPIGKDQGRSSYVEDMFANSTSKHSGFQLSHSFPEPKLSQFPGTMASLGASTSNGSTIETLSGPQFLWGSPTTNPYLDQSKSTNPYLDQSKSTNPYSDQSKSTNPYSDQSKSTAWSRPSIGHPFTSNGQSNGISRPGSFHSSNLHHNNLHHHLHHHHHIGSAPSGVPLERHFGYFQESPETSFMSSAFGGMSLGHNDRSFMVNMGTHAAMNAGIAMSNMPESGSPSFGMMSSPRLSPMFLGNAPYPGLAPTNMDSFTERGRIRRVENNENQMDSKKQFQLDLEKIISGEDTRTTLMIKNIPNKYTSKMLLAAIDEYNRGTYDFLYLPIDFKNKCNVGYAFINMLSPKHIIQFYKAFNGKKWEKFNSEKVASLAYARIQGKVALVTHFQNSSLMNEDKRCRPILFHSEGPEAGDQITQEHLPSSSLNIQIRQPNGSQAGDSPGSSPTEAGSSEKPEES